MIQAVYVTWKQPKGKNYKLILTLRKRVQFKHVLNQNDFKPKYFGLKELYCVLLNADKPWLKKYSFLPYGNFFPFEGSSTAFPYTFFF